MGCCNNKYIALHDVERCLDCGTYNITSHGDIGAHYMSIANADLPQYTARFYRPTQHELLSDVRYDKTELGYDAGARDMRDAIKGPPMESYIPQSSFLPVPAGNSGTIIVRNAERLPEKSVVDEILRAQAEVMGRQPTDLAREGFILRRTEINEEIHIKRRFRKIEIIRKKKD